MRTVLCAACWVTSAAAFAQGAFDMGMLSNTLSQGAVSGGGGGHKGHKGHKAPRRPLAKPSVVLFTPSQAVRKRAVDSLVAVYAKADPQFAKGLREEISSPAWWSSTEKEMRSYGLNPRNVADGMAVYLVQAWYGARGRVAKNPADYRAVGRQFALSLRSLPAAARLSNAAKQEMAEGFILQGVMVESFVKRAQKRPNEMPTAKANAIQGAKSLIGFDLTKLSLGANGLAPQ